MTLPLHDVDAQQPSPIIEKLCQETGDHTIMKRKEKEGFSKDLRGCFKSQFCVGGDIF